MFIFIARPLFLCALWITPLGASWANELATLQVAADEVVLVGYGSLVNRESMSRSLSRPYEGKMLPIRLQGFCLKYNVGMPNQGLFFFHVENGRQVYPGRIAYLNIEANKDCWINAVAFTIKKSDLIQFDRRESIYDRISISPEQIENAQVEGGEIFAYTGKPEFLVEGGDAHTVVRDSYHSTVSSAMREIGFYEWFHATIGAAPHPIVQDQLRPGADPFGYKSCENALTRVLEQNR